MRSTNWNPSLPVLFGVADPVVALPKLLMLMEDLWGQFPDEVRAECLVALRDLLC